MATLSQEINLLRTAQEKFDERLRTVEQRLAVVLWAFGIGSTLITGLLATILAKLIS
jgi:hypothetical protein